MNKLCQSAMSISSHSYKFANKRFKKC